MYKKILLTLLFLMAPSLSRATGSCVISFIKDSGEKTAVVFAWTSDAGQDVLVSECTTEQTLKYLGKNRVVSQCSVIPSVSAAPTALYDVTLYAVYDYGSVDISGTAMHDLPATGTDGAMYVLSPGGTYFVPKVTAKLGIHVQNAGTSTQGKVICEIE